MIGNGELLKDYRWVFVFVATVAVLVIFQVAVNFAVDPYQQFRKPSFYHTYFASSEQRRLNPGIARHYDIDSIIVGSSMMENFDLKDVRTVLHFQKPVKLLMQGANAYEEKRIMDVAFEYHRIKNVLMGVDIFSFSLKENPGILLNESLYEDTIAGKAHYLLAYSTFEKSMKVLKKSNRYNEDDPLFHYDTMYQWQHLYQHAFTVGNVLKQYENRTEHIRNNYTEKMFDADKMVANFTRLFVPFITANPSTDFTFFYPPYSVLEFKALADAGYLGLLSDFKMQLLQLLAPYPNVRVFDFQLAADVIKDLTLYKDTSHYHQKINYWMLQQIAKGHYHTDITDAQAAYENFTDMINSYQVDTALKSEPGKIKTNS